MYQMKAIDDVKHANQKTVYLREKAWTSQTKYDIHIRFVDSFNVIHLLVATRARVRTSVRLHSTGLEVCKMLLHTLSLLVDAGFLFRV